MTLSRCLAATLPFIALLIPVAVRAQLLETETARPVGRGVWEVSGNFEFQTSADGKETALPFAIEYGISNRLEFLIEPVAYTSIRPKSGASATGVGDLETTLTWLMRRETERMPAIALAGEVKFPTARSSIIGTGKTNFAGYLIASKLLGRFDAHVNFGYTIVGKPAGAPLKNIFNFALGSEFRLSPVNALFGEVLGNTASTSAGESGAGIAPGTTTPEAPSGEIVATVGYARYLFTSLRLSVGVSVDNNGAVLFRPGFTLRR